MEIAFPAPGCLNLGLDIGSFPATSTSTAERPNKESPKGIAAIRALLLEVDFYVNGPVLRCDHRLAIHAQQAEQTHNTRDGDT